MTQPAKNAFFVGRALAEVLGERLEDAFTNALSELGKFDAEQRERLRQFTEEVLQRAERYGETENAYPTPTPSTASPTGSDLQATIDELRASIASLRSELTAYKNRSL